MQKNTLIVVVEPMESVPGGLPDESATAKIPPRPNPLMDLLLEPHGKNQKAKTKMTIIEFGWLGSARIYAARLEE